MSATRRKTANAVKALEPPTCHDAPMVRHPLCANLGARRDGIWWACANVHCGRVLLEPNILFLMEASVRAHRLTESAEP